MLTVEHRSAPSAPSTLELVEEPAVHLRVVDGGPVDHDAVLDIAERIVALLSGSVAPMTRDALRAALHARNATIGEARAIGCAHRGALAHG